MKRIVTIQDISCVGKCSLTVALPILSAMGLECAILPTAVLSTHTMFRGYTFRDLTDDLPGIADHWEAEGIDFEAIYTGYLGSARQLEIVEDFFTRFGRSASIVIDPVMADNGKLYPGFTEAFAQRMALLCAHADIILPNLTEASYLLKIPYPGDCYTRSDIEEILRRLAALGPRVAVLTGISFEPGRLGVMAYDKENDCFFEYYRERLPAAFHGTGDIFASAFTGALARGKSVQDSLCVAVDYTVDCIDLTLSDPNHRTYGVNFEEALPALCAAFAPGK